ncbi:hypothetical protein LJB92_03680 [Bacteroidales bacterium OttesenSCG-928-M06]|nr:hypothetical protein [Bacteroidales bacterium OttesenSCG-928-M06]
MLIADLKRLFEEVDFPCSYYELMIQCDKTNQSLLVVDELKERFEEEFSESGELIDTDDFPEIDDTFEEEFFPIDE